ncbi:MAG: 1-deoxy-D-xylulose-5-phosphate synthase [Clostridia bacterium]|nr:1-deoxy-D-xylulose-5-phosphate synthase [Clostridia bacterium]
MEYKILSKIKGPADVKKLNNEELNCLCEEIRGKIMETVSKNGGHLASNLGAVELTVALHRAFESPKDSIIFDVGHQCYAHKLITGRFDRFDTLRTEGGITGFMRPSESEYDPVVTGHSSTSVSLAYGIYKAKRLNDEEGTAVAVIGDGALTGGMAFEGFNNVGRNRSKFIIVLNDNKMSISRNVGALARITTKLRNRKRYHYFKFALKKFLVSIPFIGRALSSFAFAVKQGLKRRIYKNNIFESFGFNYLGPVDGHDIKKMEQLFKIAQKYTRPSVVHVITTKGKGYAFAENSPKNYHGVSPFDVEKGCDSAENKSFSDVAGNTLSKLAENNKKICAITAAMTNGTGLGDFASKYKSRFFDVGIAEQHAVGFASGLATGGMIPFFAVYSSFLQRGFDQIVHDCAIANVPVKFLIDRAGIVGEDGESHQGIFDVSYLSLIPNMNIYSPSFYGELESVIERVSENDELCAVRYPRGCELNPIDRDFSEDYTVFDGKSDVCAVTYGRIFSNVYAATENSSVTAVKLNKIYPIKDELIEKLSNFKKIVFFEESIKSGGIAEHIASRLGESGYKGEYKICAINGEFVPCASVSSSLKKYGFDIVSIKKTLGVL